jgi:hypothetical protein
MVEIAVLGAGKALVLILTAADAASLALSIQEAVRDAALPPENGDDT